MDFRGCDGQQVLRSRERPSWRARSIVAATAQPRVIVRAVIEPIGQVRSIVPRVVAVIAQAPATAVAMRRGPGGRDTAFRNMSSGRAANLQSARGRASFGGRTGGAVAFAGCGGGGFAGGGGLRRGRRFCRRRFPRRWRSALQQQASADSRDRSSSCRPAAAKRTLLPPAATGACDPNVWSGRALQEVSSTWQMRSCINVSGLCLERVVLRAIMDISAHAS